MFSYRNTHLVVLDEVLTFLGNQTHSDHFKLLRQDGSSLLIGARNVVYNISLSDLTENTDHIENTDPLGNPKISIISKFKNSQVPKLKKMPLALTPGQTLGIQSIFFKPQEDIAYKS